MKTFQLAIVLLVATVLDTSNAFGFDWRPDIPTNAAVHPPVMRRMQTTTEEASSATSASEGSTAASSAATASSAPETEAPTTIMVLLPDILAPSYSGSGSTMYLAGSVGDDDTHKSAGSNSATDETSAALSAHNFGLVTVATASTILLASVLVF